MKTSNIIIFGFFTFVLAGMLTLTISAKSHEKDATKEYMENAFSNVTRLPAFSVIVGQPGSIFHIQQSSDNNRKSRKSGYIRKGIFHVLFCGIFFVTFC